MAATALHLASKYEDVEPVCLDDLLKTSTLRSIKESDILELEAEFFNLLGIFMGLTPTVFAIR